MPDFRELFAEARRTRTLDRRWFLALGSAVAALPYAAARAEAPERKVVFAADPFTSGVSSGDPTHQSVVIWTRLAPQPLEPAGGMRPESVSVTYEVGEDETLSKSVATGHVIATPQLGHSVHAEVRGLKPDRWYYFRFRCGDAVSPIGRTRTLPAPTARPDRLRFAFASCQHFEQGLYTAYEAMARDELDLVFHLGDYIYEYAAKEGLVRKHVGQEITSLEDYRARYALYRSDPLLRAAHARCPWFVTWDDHEFDNNCAGGI